MIRILLLLYCLTPLTAFAEGSNSPSTDCVEAQALLTGKGVPADPQKAFALFEKAAKDGDIEAKAAVGYLKFTGNGAQKDETHGIALLREAAEAGSPKAAFNVAQILIKKGPDSSQDALDLMTRAAASGMTEAEIALAGWYYFGEPGISVDDKKAFTLYQAAAAKGNPVAENAVGAMLCIGRGVPADRERGIEYYRKAAEKGFARAQSNLGRLYATGDVVGRNKIEALKWLFRANAQGDVTARIAIKEFLPGVNETEIDQALKTSGILRSSALNLEDPPAPNTGK